MVFQVSGSFVGWGAGDVEGISGGFGAGLHAEGGS